jgi:glyoxylase-like metal-dependent hydrolase (beta-lactamase superfamily II)
MTIHDHHRAVREHGNPHAPSATKLAVTAAVLAHLACLAGCGGPARPAPAATAAEARPLSLEVFTSSPEGFLVNATLVSGERDAILIDGEFVLSDARHLAEQIKARHKHLTAVYVTHFHPDHYFGFVALKEAFPDAKLVALPETVSEIEKTALAKVKQWQPMFKDNIPARPIVPEPVSGNKLVLDGQELDLVGNQQGDTEGSSYVVIPSLSAVICGDIVYAGVFPWTAEASPAQRKAWTTTIDAIAALHPKIVVPGHQAPGLGTDPGSLAFMKAYLKAYDEVLASSKTAGDAEAKLKARYPDLGSDFSLKLGLASAYPGSTPKPE